MKDVEGIIHYNVTNNLWYIRKTTNDIEQEYYPLHIDIKFQRTPRKVTFSGETFEIPPSYVNYNKAECYAIKLTSINYRDSIYDLTGQLGDTVSVYGVNIPYRPLNPDSLPVWMRIYLDTPILTFILKGTKDDNLVYNIYTFASSSRYGWFFDKDKNYINVRNGEEYFMAVHDWECLYYRRILVK